MLDLMDEQPRGRAGNPWLDLWPTLVKHRLAILVVFVLTVASAYVVVEFVLWERYESRSNLLLKLGRENAEVPSTVQNSALFTSGIREQEVKSITYMLTSRDVVAQVVDRVGVERFQFDPKKPETIWQHVKYYAKVTARWFKDQVGAFLILVNLKKDLSPRDKAILAVEGALNVAAEKETDVIGVRVGLPSPDLSVRVNQALLDVFFEKYVDLHRSDESFEFFDRQTAAMREKLQSLDERRDRLRAESGLSAAKEQRTLLLQRRSEAARQIDQNDADKRALQEQQRVMRERLAALPEQLERSAVSTPGSQYRRSQQGNVTSEANPVRETFRRNVEEIAAKIAGLDAGTAKQREIARNIDEQVARLDRAEDQLETLNRERTLAEQSYLTYSKRREEARIREALDQRRVANVVLMSPPSTPMEPASPKKLLIMAIALGLGLVLGVGLALLLEYLRESVDSPRDLAGIEGMPLLGTFRVDPEAERQAATRA